MLDLIDDVPRWAISSAILLLTFLGALVLHAVLLKVARRLAARTPGSADDAIVSRAAGPTRWILVLIALAIARRWVPLAPWAAEAWATLAGFVLPGLFGWCAISILLAVRDVVDIRSDMTVANNLNARRKRTRVGILTRIATFLILLLTVGVMLLAIPSVRNLGVTLMASAGIAGLVVGAAAQPALKNLIAGVQMAFTEPIRLDDVVIVEGEWGRIEEIRLTFIVVRLWDERRLVVPVSQFLEKPFQNWTRETSQLLGSTFVYVDPTADVPRIRARSAELAAANPLWDRRFTNLQVTDMKSDVMELRVLVTASDASRAFDLRCDMREALIAFIRDEMPEALPRRRIEGIVAPA